jgi:hypothetical protein
LACQDSIPSLDPLTRMSQDPKLQHPWPLAFMKFFGQFLGR